MEPARAQLQAGETLLAWFEPDLDARLHYAAGLVLLTDRRLLAAATPTSWQSFPLAPGHALRQREHGGAGALELSDETGRLAFWRFTAARSLAVSRLVQRRESFLKEQG